MYTPYTCTEVSESRNTVMNGNYFVVIGPIHIFKLMKLIKLLKTKILFFLVEISKLTPTLCQSTF